MEKVQSAAARWTCRQWRNTSSVGDMLDELEWPSLEARREQFQITFFYYSCPEKFFFPKDYPYIWNSLPSSAIASKTTEEFKAEGNEITSSDVCI